MLARVSIGAQARRAAQDLRLPRLARAVKLLGLTFRMIKLLMSVDYPDTPAGRDEHATKFERAAVEWRNALEQLDTRASKSQYKTLATVVMPKLIRRHGHALPKANEQVIERMVGVSKVGYKNSNHAKSIEESRYTQMRRGKPTEVRPKKMAPAQVLENVTSMVEAGHELRDESLDAQRMAKGARRKEWEGKAEVCTHSHREACIAALRAAGRLDAQTLAALQEGEW